MLAVLEKPLEKQVQQGHESNRGFWIILGTVMSTLPRISSSRGSSDESCVSGFFGSDCGSASKCHLTVISVNHR